MDAKTGDLNIVVQFNDTNSGVSTVGKPQYSFKFDSEPYSAYMDMAQTAGSPAEEFWEFNITEPVGGWKVYRGKYLYMKVKAVDVAGNEVISVEYTEFIDGDNAPPSCALSKPLADEWYAGTIELNATAGDTDGNISEVAFEYSTDSTDGSDGTWTQLGTSPIITAPYELSWDTVTAGITEANMVWLRARA